MHILSFKAISPLVLEKKIFLVFTIYGHGGHVGHVTMIYLNNFLFPRPLEARYEIWFRLQKLFGSVDGPQGTTSDG